jgi:hypothetical protein
LSPRARHGERRVAVQIALIHVGMKLFDQAFHRGHPTVRRVAMRVAGVSVSVANTSRVVNG